MLFHSRRFIRNINETSRPCADFDLVCISKPQQLVLMKSGSPPGIPAPMFGSS